MVLLELSVRNKKNALFWFNSQRQISVTHIRDLMTPLRSPLLTTTSDGHEDYAFSIEMLVTTPQLTLGESADFVFDNIFVARKFQPYHQRTSTMAIDWHWIQWENKQFKRSNGSSPIPSIALPWREEQAFKLVSIAYRSCWLLSKCCRWTEQYATCGQEISTQTS